MDWTNFLSAIIGAISGGIIAGYFSLKATQKSHENQEDLSVKNEKRLVSALLQSIHDELDSVYERYQESMGARIESLNDGEPLNWYYPVVSDYFTVYSGNSFLIGRISDNDLRRQIIRTYILARGLVDSYRMNNELVAKYELSEKLFEETNLEVHQEHAVAHHNVLVDYAKSLKESHMVLKQSITHLLRELRKNGVLNEISN